MEMGTRMTLVDEYLRAVALLLPKGQRDDIIAELKDIILTRIEERESELGRTLTGEETEAVLHEIGHPLVVAARYREGPQSIVGPALYPYWLFGVKVGITIALAISAVVFIVTCLASGNVTRAFDQAIHSILGGAISVVGVATIAAWLAERFGTPHRYLDRWRVKDLRYLGIAAWDLEAVREWADRSKGARTGWPRHVYWVGPSFGRSRAAEALGLIAFGTVAVLWWIGVLNFGIARNEGDLRSAGIDLGSLSLVDWAALRAELFLPCLIYAGAVVAQGVLLLAFPRVVWLRGLVEAALGVFLLMIVGWLWQASPIASAVRVDSIASFVARMETMGRGTPVPLAPLLTLILACAGFGAAVAVIKGAGRVLLGLFAGTWAEERL